MALCSWGMNSHTDAIQLFYRGMGSIDKFKPWVRLKRKKTKNLSNERFVRPWIGMLWAENVLLRNWMTAAFRFCGVKFISSGWMSTLAVLLKWQCRSKLPVCLSIGRWGCWSVQMQVKSVGDSLAALNSWIVANLPLNYGWIYNETLIFYFLAHTASKLMSLLFWTCKSLTLLIV